MPSQPSDPRSAEFEAYATRLLGWEERETDHGRVIILPPPGAPIEAEGAPLPASSSSRLPARTSLRQRLADLSYISLVTTGWFAGNLLGVLGCAVVFFIVLSAGQWDAFFLQVDNLTSRYVEADIGRRGLFEHYLVQTFMLLFIGITLLRAPGFIRRVRRELAEAPRP